MSSDPSPCRLKKFYEEYKTEMQLKYNKEKVAYEKCIKNEGKYSKTCSMIKRMMDDSNYEIKRCTQRREETDQECKALSKYI